MNLSKLFEMQKALDEKIIREKGLEGQDLLPMKILALQVELGECANEWRGFKFWSNNQKPRTYAGNEADGSWNPLLEEYCDCLHFILCIGLYHEYDNFVPRLDLVSNRNITIIFSGLLMNRWHEYWEYGHGMNRFLKLGELLGFTWEEIEQAYISKNEVNHNRQANGY